MSFISSGEFELAVAEEVAEVLRLRRERSNPAVATGEDDFFRWVASHEDSARFIVCSWPGLEGAPFCCGAHHVEYFKK